jgi:hypothetical protein
MGKKGADFSFFGFLDKEKVEIILKGNT